MYRDFVWPEISLVDIILIIIVILFFISVIYFIVKNYFNQSKKERSFLIESYCKRFKFNQIQYALIKKLFNKFIFLKVNSYFTNEMYFNESTLLFLNKTKAKEQTKNDFKEIKSKIIFTKKTPELSKEIPVGQTIKIRLKRLGFISAKIINNDDDGILLSIYFKKITNKIETGEDVVIYYWDDTNQYEVKTKIKKISEVDFIQYILVNHSVLRIKNKATQGFTLNEDLPVYFTHIFKLSKELNIKKHYFKGNINTFSMIGAEVFTKFKVNPTGIFLFEFHPLENKDKRYHLTGKAVNSKRVKRGNLIFIKYLDMNEECKKYIHQIIIDRLNHLK